MVSRLQNEIKEFPTYWICDNCAKSRGLIPPSWNVTCVLGTCGHCKSGLKTTLTPIVDYKDPKSGIEPIWD